MINLSKSGDTIVFEFINNGHYLDNGTIEVPVNSLSLVTDSSNMCTFYKSDSHDIFISATYDELGKTKAEMLEWFEENMVAPQGGGGGGVTSGQVQTMIDDSVSGFADSVLYNSTSKYVEFYNGGTGGTKVYEFDASDFVIDGMVDDVRIETISGVSYLVIDFNTASGKEDIQIPLTDIFDPSNYYTKTDVDGIVSGKADSSAVTQEISAAVSGKVDTSTYTAYTAATEAVLSGKTSVVNLTQAQYEAMVTGGTVDPTVLYNITDATPIDMSQYWTSAQTNSAITQAVSGKQDTLSAGTGISISGNVISATGGGGGKAIEAGRGIDITTGAAADTVSFNLPISAGTGTYSLIFGNPNNEASASKACAFGSNCKARKENSFAIGYNTDAKEVNTFAAGQYAVASGFTSMSLGRETISSNMAEFACGQHNVSNKANTTWGDSGNTLFSVGNGTADNAKHNAFEIRQNGDIYYFDGTNDVKLQDKFSSLDTTIGNINSVLNNI